MAMNPFEKMGMTDEQPKPTNSAEDVEEISPSAVEEKRKMWQIFTDDNGEIQRKSFPMEGSEQAQTPVQGQSPPQEQAPLLEKSPNVEQVEPTVQSAETAVTISEGMNDAALFGSLNGFANPNAHVFIPNGNVPNGDVTLQIPPPKPARRVQIIPRSSGNPTDTVVFQQDTTYTRFDTIEVDSDEELFGDGETSKKPAEEHHYVGNKVLIRSESDLDILLKSPKQRIWLPNSRYCCDLYKWPMARSYAKVLAVGLAMTGAYVAIVLIIVYAMK